MDAPTKMATATHAPGSLAGARPCPYLGSTEGRELPIAHPSRRNVCCAQSRAEWHGLRRKAVAEARVHRATQAEYCLGEFTRCAHYARAARRAEKARAKAPPAGAAQGRRPKRPRRRREAPREGRGGGGRRLLGRLPGQTRTTLRYGAIGIVTVALALGLTAFFAANPSRWVEFVFFTILKEKIQTFAKGQTGLPLPGQAPTRAAGLPGGKSLQALKSLSGAKKKQLMKKFKGLSAAQKAKLRKRFRGR